MAVCMDCVLLIFYICYWPSSKKSRTRIIKVDANCTCMKFTLNRIKIITLVSKHQLAGPVVLLTYLHTGSWAAPST